MNPKPKIELLPPVRRELVASVALDSFDEAHVRRDLARFANMPGIFTQYVERARIRFQKGSERAVLEHWIHFYETGQRLIAARTEMERKRSEYLQLAREHELKETEKTANVAKFEADLEEHNLRRDKAGYQRQHLERFMEGAKNSAVTENEQKLKDADERRNLDARWQLYESLRPLHSLIELQHWRRQQRDQILKDRSLSPEEQSEDLRFVDDLYLQKRTELTADTRICEDP